MSDENVYISLTFRLSEQVTPTHLAQRVATACFNNYALRPDEAVVVPDGSGREFVSAPAPNLDEVFKPS